MIVTMIARLLRIAKMAEDPLTAASKMSFTEAMVSFLCSPVHHGSPQTAVISSISDWLGPNYEHKKG